MSTPYDKAAARVPRDRPGRAHRRADRRGARRSARRRWCGRSMSRRTAKYVRVTRMTQAVLLHRAGQQLRPGRGSVGRRRQGAHQAERARDQPRRAGRHAAAADPAAGGRRRPRRRREQTASARSRGAPTARASPISSRSRRPPAARGRGARGGPRPARRRPGSRRQPARGPRRAAAPRARIRVFQWLPPFDDASKKVLYENNTRMTGHRFSPDMQG